MAKKKKSETNDNNETDISDLDLSSNYTPSSLGPISPGGKKEIPESVKQNMEELKKGLEKFKKQVLKKYSFIKAIGILPPQICQKFEEEERIPEEEAKKKPIHLMMLIPEEQFKNVRKIKAGIVDMVKDMEPKVWVHVKSPVDVWNYCLDSKFELVSGVSMSYPLHDDGLLGSLRVAEIHKNLVLKKFEKYVVSYVIAGSLVRGDAVETSDVDVYIIIDDTDVKRMSRVELRERLRGIIYSYVIEASELAGVKNKLSPQIYTLTDFWESVKDAHPVIFTFLRDGVPLYDRGTFMPWKSLLKMGRIKPSPEAIDMFMSMGDKVSDKVKKRLLELVIGDIYWGVLTPSQALLMLYGLPPPKPKETADLMKKIFVTKEKLLEAKYIKILDNIVSLYKDYEHGKVKEVKGEKVDKFLKDSEDFMKRLKELREQIEKRANEKTIEQIYNDVMKLLKGILGNKSKTKLINDFEKKFIKTGKMPPQSLPMLKGIIKARDDFKKGKLDKHEVEDARKSASIIINDLIEYNQRCDLVSLERGRMQLKYGKDKKAELMITDKDAFLIKDNEIFKVANKLEKAKKEELDKAVQEQKGKLHTSTDNKIFQVLEKEIGKFEIIL